MQTNAQLLANPHLSGVVVLDGGLTTTPGEPTSIVNAGAGTYSAAAIASGCILRDCAGAGRTDTIAAAASLISVLPLEQNGATHECIVVNVSDAAETITLAGATGVTVTGAIAQGSALKLTFIRTSATTVLVQGTSVAPGTLSGNLTVTGDVAVGGTLEVTGASTLAALACTTFAPTGASTLAALACTTFAPTGLSTLAGVTVTGTEKTALATAGVVIDTAGAGTYTGANLATGRILRDCAGAGRTDTTDTAANIITALGLSADYQERYCELVNTSDDVETITLDVGVGVTMKGTITVAQNEVTRLAFMRTGAAAVCVREV